ncbi:MAG: sulfite exporter TauE/SafE family protein [Candidatus Omnitrophica bacterium]|nr:sulfite exporter TauE/SafE family protein [Candidatus Omnitrophota bacterium]
MKENLYYLFVSGLVLGSGPCLGFCGPFLLAYTAAYKASIRQSFFSYLIFSGGRLVSYAAWGLVCVLAVAFFQSPGLAKYTRVIYCVLGGFIIFLGLAILLGKNNFFKKACEVIHQGNVRNVGVAGFLAGLSPCLPLIGILNYVALIAKSPSEAMLFLLVFGLGTVISSAAILIFFGAKVVLEAIVGF